MKVQISSGLNVKDSYLVPADSCMDDASYCASIWFRVYKGGFVCRCRCISYGYPSSGKFQERVTKEEWAFFAAELRKIERISDCRYIGLVVLIIISLIAYLVLYIRNPRDPAQYLFVIICGLSVVAFRLSIDRQEMMTCKICHVYNRYLFHQRGVQARFQKLFVCTGSTDFCRYYIKLNIAAQADFETVGVQFPLYRMGVKGEEMDYLAIRIMGVQLSRYPREKDLDRPDLEKKLRSLQRNASGDEAMEEAVGFRASAKVKPPPPQLNKHSLPPLIFHKYATVPDGTSPTIPVALGASGKHSTRVQVVLPDHAKPGTTLQVTHPVTGQKHEFKAPPGSYPNMTLIIDL